MMSSDEEDTNIKGSSPGNMDASGFQASLLRPQLDTIFSEVEQNLPTIDFETSDLSSEEGDTPIFHHLLKTPTDEEDNLEFFDTDLNDEALVWSANKLKQVNDTDTDPGTCILETKTSSDDSTSQCPIVPTAKKNNWMTDGYYSSRGRATDSEEREEKRKEVPELSPIRSDKDGNDTDEDCEAELCQIHKNNDAGRKEHRLNRNVEKSREIVSNFMPIIPPTLTLNHISFDDTGGAFIPKAGEKKLPVSSKNYAKEESGQGENSPSLMECLTRMSLGNNSSSQNITPAAGTSLPQNCDKQTKTARNRTVAATAIIKNEKPYEKPKTKCMGTSTTNLSETAPLLKGGLLNKDVSKGLNSVRSDTARETVFLDLRGNDKNRAEERSKSEAVKRILHITRGRSQATDSSSSESEEEDLLLWHEQRKQIKASIQTGGKADVNKLHNNISKNSSKKPSNCHAPVHVLAKQSISQAKEKIEAGVAEVQSIQLSQSNAAQKALEQRQEAARRFREQRDAERQSRIRLGERLNALKPTTSIDGKNPAAEETPTLFDAEASYEPKPQNLPPQLPEDTEMVLLTIHLSTSGEIIYKPGTSKHVDSGMGFSASYVALLTWLLSLVPNNYNFLWKKTDDSPPDTSVPFRVVGLQQLCLDGRLALYVVVVPAVIFTAKDIHSRVKKTQRKDSTPFRQILTRFLTTGTLQTLCPWLECFVSLEIVSARDSHNQSFVYKPPLPKITTRQLASFIHISPDLKAVQKLFGMKVGFFWHTIETESSIHDIVGSDTEVNNDTQNTMSLVYKKIYLEPASMMGVLNRVLQEGLDLSGIRLLYPTTDLMNVAASGENADTNSKSTVELDVLNSIGPVLSLAIRGNLARSIWLDNVGPSDPTLARRTDPNSLCALFGGESREESLLFCPRNPGRVLSELCRWFGGRVPASGVIDIGPPIKTDSDVNSGKKSKKTSSMNINNDEDGLVAHKPPATLCATTECDVYLVLAPIIPVAFLGLVISVSQRRGYRLIGIRRTRLSNKKATSLGMSSSQAKVFTTSEWSSSPKTTDTPRPSTLLLLRKENGVHHVASLVEAFMVQLSLINKLGDLSENKNDLVSSQLFHVAPFSNMLLTSLGGEFTKVPDTDLSPLPGYIMPEMYTNPEMEQTVVLTLAGHKALQTSGLFLSRLLGVTTYSRSPQSKLLSEGLELLGVKWLSSLNQQQAKQLTPYELGDKGWKPSIQTLTSGPALVLLFRGGNAFSRLESVIQRRSPTPSGRSQGPSLEYLMSTTPDLAYHQATLFFLDRELFPDNSARSMLNYLPPARNLKSEKHEKELESSKRKNKSRQKGDVPPEFVTLQEESVLQTMLSDARPITSLVVLKPSAVQRHLGRLLKRLAQEDFQTVALRTAVLTTEQAKCYIPFTDQQDPALSMHIEYLTSGQSVIMCVQRENAVRKLLELLGPEDPRHARQVSAFYWRGMFGTDQVANGLYCSGSYSEAVRDVKTMFPEGLCCKINVDLQAEQITCPAMNNSVGVEASKLRQTVIQSAFPRPQTLVEKELGIKPTVLEVETNCIFLMPSLIHTSGKQSVSPHLDIIDHLLKQGCQLVGARMLWLSKQQAECLLKLTQAGSFALVPHLTSGASMVLAFQRENSILLFDSLLGSTFDKESLRAKYSKQLIKAKDAQQACRLLEYFFASLSPSAQCRIVSTEQPNNQ